MPYLVERIKPYEPLALCLCIWGDAENSSGGFLRGLETNAFIC